jgi:hypothetical protein
MKTQITTDGRNNKNESQLEKKKNIQIYKLDADGVTITGYYIHYPTITYRQFLIKKREK